MSYIDTIIEENIKTLDETFQDGLPIGEAEAYYQYAIEKDNMDVLKSLINNNISMNFVKNGGNPPLNNALKKNRIEMARLLIDSGADLSLVNLQLGNALHHSTIPKDTSILELLLEKGIYS